MQELFLVFLSTMIPYMWRRLELDSLDECCNGTQLVKVWQGYETGMGGGWQDKCSPVLHYIIAGTMRKKEKYGAIHVSAVSFTITQ